MTTTREGLSNWRNWVPGLRNGAAGTTIEQGGLYVHEGVGKSMELAHVIDTATDEFGICHVRFLLAYRLQDKIMQAGERTLAEETFSKRFARRVDNSATATASAAE
jgi:hypothetical protein